jgi:hypothetical protein
MFKGFIKPNDKYFSFRNGHLTVLYPDISQLRTCALLLWERVDICGIGPPVGI